MTLIHNEANNEITGAKALAGETEKKRLVLLGSTGSIGEQTLEVVRRCPDNFVIAGLACGKRIDRLIRQIEEFRPQAVAVEEETAARRLRELFPGLEALSGEAGLCRLAGQIEADLVLNALVGVAGLKPTLEAGRAGRDVALANKETLVAGGELVTTCFKASGARLLPVDSEHSAIFQALAGNAPETVAKLILTASGGPFLGWNRAQLEQVKPEQALRHPNWEMGRKVTIDSATLMNKGLELIEARWLFDIPEERIEVVIHPESLIHSMVEYNDCSVIAQISLPDMRLPISYALHYPDRPDIGLTSLDFTQIGQMTFRQPDHENFPALELARQALRAGGGAATVLNSANEVMVDRFLNGKAGFLDIPDKVARALAAHRPVERPSLEELLEIDRVTRERVCQWV
ncbi:MAG TPA: 1-deoxy-D-xylulose-5-phosphate reductoisomerase [Clostridiales bacterium]|jgi:1-deoxy-D-xylulose-5-phosphate reductoisomerase|nr:1-deoxy-D-xylulose-5-phosphate reductoisomerase [Clostridiales bacterium]